MRFCAYCGEPEHEPMEIAGIKVKACPAIPPSSAGAPDLPPVDHPSASLKGAVTDGILKRIQTDMAGRGPLTEAEFTDTVSELRKWSDRMRDLPPMAHVIRAHHAVPYGRVYRQWDTAGRLMLWINRGQLEDLPRAAPRAIDLFAPRLSLGIPVVYE